MEFTISTKRGQDLIDITSYIKNAVRESGVKEGLAVVFVPHTTAGVTINENGDPDVVTDIIEGLNKAFPVRGNYLHFEGNSHAHIKASFMGSSVNLIIENASPRLGTWQSVYLCEFDGPRTRRVLVKILEG
ncbi:MAG: secondary thiamine-phosphate synthase enzyme YjbQ [Caldicoprobacterales bacterium]|jgi:secondary thiamine-phosphate synthase enzyme|nr:secondary thiamine-phosphate synthase enzyme YjbQ [Clostridia bacterium]MDI9512287.1 secondary thiamine-phosphate synthase enzyme YjbQ [Bacillota bacterium]